MKAKIGGREIGYEDAGTGASVVLLHGHPLNRSMWSAQFEALQANYRVVCPDLRGYGETAEVSDVSTMSEMAQDVAALLDYLKLETIILGGLSMGGYAALEFYNLFPTRVSALVLADTKAASDTEEARQKRFETAEKIEKEGIEPLADEMLPKMLAPATRSTKPEIVERVRQMMLATKPSGAAAALRGMAARSDHTKLLAKISVPTLVIVGETDELTPPAEAEKMNRAIKDSLLVKISNAGHLSPLENPAEFNPALLNFLSAIQ
ncbi:MAG TPA: alpha/beta fold hydrolase [Pyrinomonadaceae bacterium]|jgi:pimeloyl-ACP methyl ester carboxylesterase